MLSQAVRLTPQTPFEMFRAYETRGVFCKCNGVEHSSAVVIGHDYDHMGRLNLIVQYSDGIVLPLTAEGSNGLGYPHARDLVLS